MAGEIVHLELPSRSFERSAAFYGKVFGWRADGAQSGGHLLFETTPAEAGGGPQGVRGSWILHALAQAPGPLPFVAVDDIGATLAEVERQGGRILVPRLSLAGRGEFGLLADPDGNVIAVMVKSGADASRAPEPEGGAPRPSGADEAADDSKGPAGARPPTGGRAKAPGPEKPAPAKVGASGRTTAGKGGAKAASRRKR
jgi:predicted enzyme related to lactoylglutathione lyase